MPASLNRLTTLLISYGLFFSFMSAGCSGFGPPDRPRHVEATALSQDRIYLTWTCTDEEIYVWPNPEPVTPQVSYYIYRDGSELADVEDLEYTDTGLVPDTLYCYRVSSYWDDSIFDWFYVQESDPSRETCEWTYPLNTVSGSVSLAGAGFEGVEVQLIRSLGFPSVSATTTTGAGGYFTFNDLENFQYEVLPVMDGYVFSPALYTLNLVNESATGIDFTASPAP